MVAARANPVTPAMIPIVFPLGMKPPFALPVRALDLRREALPEKPKSPTAAERFLRQRALQPEEILEALPPDDRVRGPLLDQHDRRPGLAVVVGRHRMPV